MMRGLLSPQIQYLESKGIKTDSFSHYMNPRRGVAFARLLAITASVVLCYVFLTSMSMHSDLNIATSEHNETTKDPSSSLISGKSQTQVQKEQIESLTTISRPIYYTIHTGEPYDIDSAIREVLRHAPDEIYIRQLLTPITSGGKQKLQEIGIRVRMFKKYFDPWESLHVVTDGLSNTAFVRDDIVRYLRDTKNISAISDKPRAEVIRRYESYRHFLSSLSNILFPWTTPYFSDHMTLHGHMYNAGRGIVMSGSDEQAPYMLTAISSLRALGCNLPVEIMYLGDNDLNEDMRERLEALPDVVTRDLRQMVDDQGWELTGWAGKAFATFMSSFREVILLDADVLFFRNPETLFEDQGYLDTGALFFRDRVVNPTDKRTFMREILPKPISKKAKESTWWIGSSSEYQETGVVVVDKWRHFLSIFLTARLNGPDRANDAAGEGTYSFWWGDKETWWVGFELAGDTDYQFHGGDSGNMGQIAFVDRAKLEHDHNAPEEPEIKMNILSNAGGVHEDVHEEEEEVEGIKKSNRLEGAKNEEMVAEEEGKPKRPAAGDRLKHLEDNQESEEKEKDQSSSEQKEDHPSSEQEKDQSTSDKEKDQPTSEQEKDKPSSEQEKSNSETQPQESNDNNNNRIDRRTLSRREWFNDRAFETIPGNHFTPSTLYAMDSVNYTLCSPQLLHLDTSGRPLWFNGWVQDDKFDHDPRVAVSTFDFFMPEKRKDGTQADWALGNHNNCCLKGDLIQKFTDEEKEVLDMIVGIGRENGALSPIDK